MPNIAVRCPVCERVCTLRGRIEQKTFYHCGLTHLIDKCKIAEGQKQPKRKKQIEQKKIEEGIFRVVK